MSTGKNFDLLRESVGRGGPQADCAIKGTYGDGRLLVAWAENDALGVKLFLSNNGKRIEGQVIAEFLALANAYVKWGAFVQEPDTEEIAYKSMLTSHGDESNRVDRVRDWLGYSLGVAIRFGAVYDRIASGVDTRSAFENFEHEDAGVRRRWLDAAQRSRVSTHKFDATYTEGGRQIAEKMDEVASVGDVIDADLARTVCNRYRRDVLSFLNSLH